MTRFVYHKEGLVNISGVLKVNRDFRGTSESSNTMERSPATSKRSGTYRVAFGRNNSA